MGETEAAALERLAPSPAPAAAPPAPSPSIAALLGRYANGPDTLTLLAHGDSLRYRYGGEESPLTVAADGSLPAAPATPS